MSDDSSKVQECLPKFRDECVICSADLAQTQGLTVASGTRAHSRSSLRQAPSSSISTVNTILWDLCKILKVSPTIYSNIDDKSLSSSSSPCQFYCSLCEAMVQNGLQMTEEIEKIKSNLDLLVDKIKRCFITSYSGNFHQHDSSPDSHHIPLPLTLDCDDNTSPAKTKNISGDDDPNSSGRYRSVVKSQIRRTFAQCWSSCSVNISQEKKLTKLPKDSLSENLRSNSSRVSLKGRRRESRKRKIVQYDDFDLGNDERKAASGTDDDKFNDQDHDSNYAPDSPDSIVYPQITITESESDCRITEFVDSEIGDNLNHTKPQLPSKSTLANKRRNAKQEIKRASKVKLAKVLSVAKPQNAIFSKRISRNRKYTSKSKFVSGSRSDVGLKNVKNTLKLFRHTQRPGKKFKYSCKDCGKGYDILFYYENHVKCHEGDLNFECNICRVKFVSERSVKAHKVRIHDSLQSNNIDADNDDITNDPVIVLDPSSHDQISSNQNQITISQFEVDKSGDKNLKRCRRKSKKLFSSLRTKTQNQNRNQSQNQKKQNQVTCSVCNEGFHTAAMLHRHEIKMHSFPCQNTFDDHGKLVVFKCGYCDKEYFKSNYMTGDEDLCIQIQIKCDQEECEQYFIDFRTFQLHHGNTCSLKPSETASAPAPEEQPETAAESATEEEAIIAGETETIPDKSLKFDSSRSHVLSPSINVKNTLKIFRHSQKNIKRQYNCEICGKGYDLLPYFQDHMKCHQGDLKSECDICHVKFVSDRSVRNHKMRVHEDPGSDLATLKRSRQIAKTLRIEAMRNNKVEVEQMITNEPKHNYSCYICGKGYDALQYYEDHLKSHQGELDFQCDICPEKFVSERCLSAHKTRIHGTKSERIYDDSGTGSGTGSGSLLAFICCYCKKEYRKSNYPGGEIKCDIFMCDRTYLVSRFSNFCNHHEATCLAKPVEILKCDICNTDKVFCSKASLENHIIAIHTKQFPFYCEECGSGQVSAGALADHQRSVHSGRRFKCNLCDRTYKIRKHLDNHLRRHNNDLRYVCGHCGRKFLTSRHLATHELVRHTATANDFICDICNKGFRTKSYLRHHVWAVHEKLRKKKLPSKSETETIIVQNSKSQNHLPGRLGGVVEECVEGVYYEEEINYEQDDGCQGQGHEVSVPIPANDFEVTVGACAYLTQLES